MTVSADIAELVLEALTAAPDTTDAGPRVYLPRDWPLELNLFPVLLLQVLRERKESLGRAGAQQFTTTATIRIIGRVSGKAAADDAGAGAVEAALWRLQRQVEIAVINYAPLEAAIQHMPFVEASVGLDSGGAQHVGQLRIDAGFEFYQGPEDFHPFEVDEIDLMHLDVRPADLPGVDVPLDIPLN